MRRGSADEETSENEEEKTKGVFVYVKILGVAA